MKTAKYLLVVLIVLLCAPAAFAAGLGHLRVSYLKGDVQVKTPETGEWGLAAVNAPLAEGDQVWVPDGGRVELQLNGGSFLRLDQGSSLQILSLDQDSSQFYLAQGRVYVYSDAPPGSVLQVDTPDASTRVFEKTVYRIDMGDQFSDVSVYKGYVEAENAAGTTRINAGEMLSLGQDSDGVVAPMGPPDEWETWNKSRNRRYAASVKSTTYLPEELRYYASDFDSNGRWVYVQDYGNVWTPTVSVTADWSPYRDGRWCWRGGDYVWIGREPWGWAPYHYGRWAFVPRVGWCWVPPARKAVYWSPGYVGWVTTPDSVAWVPLAPGEVYYGRGYYGPNSVNITNVNVTEVRITNVYRNVHVNNGVTVVRRDSFATSSPARIRADQAFVRNNLLARGSVRPGAPDIRPSRERGLFSAREVPRAKLPPQRVRGIEVQALKKERPLVRDRGRSVLAPGAAPRPLPVREVETKRRPGSGRPELRPAQRGGGAPRGDARSPAPTRPAAPGEASPSSQARPAAPAGSTPPAARPAPEKVNRPPVGNAAESGRRTGDAERSGRSRRGPQYTTPPAPSASPAARAPEGRPAPQATPPQQQAEPRKRVRPTPVAPATGRTAPAPSAQPATPPLTETPARARDRQRTAPAVRVAPAAPSTPSAQAPRTPQVQPPQAPAVRPHVQHPSRPAAEVPSARPGTPPAASPAAPKKGWSGETYRPRTPKGAEPPAASAPAGGAAPAAAPAAAPPADRDTARPERRGRGE